jgi:DNA-binding transcriptional MerR regulator
MRIAQAARAAGVATQSVEYYIMIGLVKPIRRGQRSRFFDAKLVNRIKLIRRLNKSGYTLRSIRETYLRGK